MHVILELKSVTTDLNSYITWESENFYTHFSSSFYSLP